MSNIAWRAYTPGFFLAKEKGQATPYIISRHFLSQDCRSITELANNTTQVHLEECIMTEKLELRFVVFAIMAAITLASIGVIWQL